MPTGNLLLFVSTIIPNLFLKTLPQSYDFIFIPARDFREKLRKCDDCLLFIGNYQEAVEMVTVVTVTEVTVFPEGVNGVSRAYGL